ncbi:MAG: NAD-dependent malic enzyme [Bdellovibrionales bacterium GWB1_52_6]|nr:MAG: NAD-dependent malic enzyme [Bdellovibrionales bacterium GWB1_52_6]OFZ05136.1 MAG: NAD-dependent malic enzyme [Bdellovibrionales bacterium GWA1_52_35]HCM38886.1 NAD-dependent malic enzyme [Bdellovibrionales bacterium]
MTQKSSKLPEPKPGIPKGTALLNDPLFNKGSAFTMAERSALGLSGLLPSQVCTIENQVERVMENYHKKSTDLERYIHLVSLQDRNETLFYRVIADNLEAMMPIVYTPTVGSACQQFGHIFRRSRGMYISYEDRGNIAQVIKNWPSRDVRVIVMTDGERILGLGDQGASGMGIPIGKLSLYTACCGIAPSQTLPVMLDVGTENETYLKDPLYMGLRQKRVRGPEYEAFVAEFIEAAREAWPNVMIQFEDFGNKTAFRLLEIWRDKICTFNDDIQGTAAVTLAGIFSALRLTQKTLLDQRILLLGAGEAGVGIGDLIVTAMVDRGAKLEEARSKIWFVDSQGLVVKSRTGLAEHKLRFAHDFRQIPNFVDAIEAIQPTAIIGVSTLAKAFSREVIEKMSKINERPIIFALSNPTSKAECSAEEAYTWSKGKAIYASGSPFPPFNYEGKTFVPGQGNNCYIFPGVGLGVVATKSKRVTDRMFAESARSLAEQTSQADLDMGRIYPALNRIQEVSAIIAAAVAEVAFRDGLAGVPKPANTLDLVKASMWKPEYESYLVK